MRALDAQGGRGGYGRVGERREGDVIAWVVWAGRNDERGPIEESGVGALSAVRVRV